MQSEEIAAVFTEWHRRWNEEPARFKSEYESLAMPDDSYGDSAGRYFEQIANELRGDA